MSQRTKPRRARNEGVRRRVRALRHLNEHLNSPTYLPALTRLARSYLVQDRLFEVIWRALEDSGLSPEVLAAMESLRRHQDSAMRQEHELMLSPRSLLRIAIAPDLAIACARLVSPPTAALPPPN